MILMSVNKIEGNIKIYLFRNHEAALHILHNKLEIIKKLFLKYDVYKKKF